MEIRLLERLKEMGVSAKLDCVDFNPSLGDQAVESARRRKLADDFQFFVEDCNKFNTGRKYDVIIVNQFFHHVTDLEAFCFAIKNQLLPHGVLLTCDVVGRNGHVLWPSVNKYVQDAWYSLTSTKRFDRHFNKVTEEYVSVDHSSYSNEGVRAQDVIPVLADNFAFDLFITFGGAIMPFVERRIGFNFSLDETADLEFIDELAAFDATALREGKYPASNMIAALRHPGTVSVERFFPISHHDYLRVMQAEKSLL